MTPSTPIKWHVPHHAGLRWRFWGDEVIVFHPPSGDTHILHPLAADLLQYLSRQAADLQQIAAYLASEDDPGPSLELLSKLLADFDQLGLIEPSHEAA